MIFMNEHGISGPSVNYLSSMMSEARESVVRQAKMASLLSLFLEFEEVKATKTSTVAWW
jgi:hypothetical protein